MLGQFGEACGACHAMVHYSLSDTCSMFMLLSLCIRVAAGWQYEQCLYGDLNPVLQMAITVSSAGESVIFTWQVLVYLVSGGLIRCTMLLMQASCLPVCAEV